MLGNGKKPQDTDALDTLRRWIKINHFDYGSLDVSLTIQKGVIEIVKLEQGGAIRFLKAEELLND